MDTIFIEDIRIPMIIGIYPHERTHPQTVSISLQIGTSTKVAGVSDNIADTIDYSELVERLRSDLQSRQFSLVERLAEHIASVLINDSRILWTRVSIEKPGVLPEVRRVGVTIERSNTKTTSEPAPSVCTGFCCR